MCIFLYAMNVLFHRIKKGKLRETKIAQLIHQMSFKEDEHVHFVETI